MKTTKAEAPKPVLPALESAPVSTGLPPSSQLKDEYPNVAALYGDIQKNMAALSKESAAVYVDGRLVFPLNADGTTIETGRIWHERENRWILADVGNSAYATQKDGKLKR